MSKQAEQPDAPDATDAQLDTEFAYTNYEQSCKEPAVTPSGSLRECRRTPGHQGRHASGFRNNRYRW